jgi:biotin synthase-related radical SAM superfamily protein
MLKSAGANEVKYNLETLDSDLFPRICPGISFQEIMNALEEAVCIFGKNKVFSNVLVGLGESDETLRQGIDELAEMGVMPILRAVFPHPLREGELEMDRPSKERLLGLAHHLKRTLEKNELYGDFALTGCYLCTGCDLAPGQDL